MKALMTLLCVAVATVFCAAEEMPFNTDAHTQTPWAAQPVYTNVTAGDVTVTFTNLGGSICLECTPGGHSYGCYFNPCGCLISSNGTCPPVGSCAGPADACICAPTLFASLIYQVEPSGPTCIAACTTPTVTLHPGQSLRLGHFDCDQGQDNCGGFTGTLVVTPVCSDPPEILDAYTLDNEPYYNGGQTVSCAVTFQNICSPREVRVRIATISWGVKHPSFPDWDLSYFVERDMRVVTLPTGIAPQDFGWDAPYWPWGAVPQDVRVTVETLEGEIIAQHVIGYDVYWLSPLLHSTWLWTHDAVEACRNGDMGCWGAILGVIPGLDPIATPLAFADGICRAEELRNAGNSGWGLQVGRTVFETVELPYEIELPSSEFDARQEAFDCLKPIVHENLPELDDAVRAVEFVSNLELLFIPDYESPYFLYDQYRAYIAVSGAFSEGLNVYERSQLLSIEVPIEAKSRDASYARSTLDTIGISDGLVIPFEDDNILLGHLGRRATAAGDSLAHNQYRSAVFGHTAARAETIGVSFLHVLPDCTTQRLDWTGLVVDSAGGFRIPASDTTDCIKMFMDQDGDGMFEQTVYPEVGGASIRLVVMVDGDSIRLSWKPVYCASSYRVYWGSALDEITTQLTETADTTCADPAIGSVRFYQVKAVFP